MSEKYKTYPGGTFFITLTVCGWIDVFTRSQYAHLIVENLNYCVQYKGLRVYAWVIMSNHIHLVAGSESNLSSIIRDFKSYTSKAILSAIAANTKESRRRWLLFMFRHYGKMKSDKREYQFWREGFHPISVDRRWFSQKVNYIHQNPVKAGIVDEPEHYVWSSAHPFSGVLLEPW
jgi:REP element-mobilizing transposase RayT